MNGVLWKWTNYYSGWQPRWFILKDGILSYYRSEEEVQSGSKGSINLSVCDLNVSNFDNTRFEIVIPGEQKYHLKASNIQERQRWIVALGSCKACHIEPEFEVNANSSITGLSLPINEITSKESEMRLYMELMNQQVLSIKSHLSENYCPDINSINDLTSTLNAACDTFLASLKDLMTLIALNSSLLIDSPPTHVGSPVFCSLNTNGEEVKNRKISNFVSGSRFSMDNGFVRFRNRKSVSQEMPVSLDSSSIENRRKTNFFIQMTHSFVDWSHVVGINNNISTMNYINSFWSLLHFLDNFDTSPIMSLKLDIVAYVKRLTQKYESDREKFSILESIINSERCHSQPLNVESATYVIRALNRSLVFIEYFLQYLHNWITSYHFEDTNEENALKVLLTQAYDATLENKLNWLDQGLFTIIIKSLPTFSEFLSHLLCQHSEADKPVNILFTTFRTDIDQLLVDMNTYRNSVILINSCLTRFLSDIEIEL